MQTAESKLAREVVSGLCSGAEAFSGLATVAGGASRPAFPCSLIWHRYERLHQRQQ
jgi:hypothetical protein